MTIEQLKEAILSHVFKNSKQEVYLTAGQRKEIQQTVKKKYSQWEWNFGTSPKCSFTKHNISQNQTHSQFN